MPFLWIQLPFGVSHLAVVNFKLDPSVKSFGVWTVPLPNVLIPISGISADSVKAPARISDADALPSSMTAATGTSIFLIRSL